MIEIDEKTLELNPLKKPLNDTNYIVPITRPITITLKNGQKVEGDFTDFETFYNITDAVVFAKNNNSHVIHKKHIQILLEVKQ